MSPRNHVDQPLSKESRLDAGNKHHDHCAYLSVEREHTKLMTRCNE